jgi:hypothetical protein
VDSIGWRREAGCQGHQGTSFSLLLLGLHVLIGIQYRDTQFLSQAYLYAITLKGRCVRRLGTSAMQLYPSVLAERWHTL